MLSRLNEIFAFALWVRSRQSLLLARGGLAVKPSTLLRRMFWLHSLMVPVGYCAAALLFAG